MGKKRRLLTTKKFRAKHSAHPRMYHLSMAPSDTTAPALEIVEEEVKVVAAATVVAPIPTLTAEAAETKTATPKTPKVKKKTSRKKTVTSTRKRTSKKKTITATA